MKLTSGLLLLLAIHSAPIAKGSAPNTLTPEEKAAGYTLLFDGRDIPGFHIDGDFQIQDGVLMLGGAKPTLASITTALPSNFELRLKYRLDEPQRKATPGRGWAQLQLRQQRFLGFRGSDQQLFGSTPPTPEDWWDELILTGVSKPTSDEFETIVRFVPEELAPHGTISGWPGKDGNFTLSFWLPVGSKLQLRDVKLRADAVSWWQTPWPFLLVLATGLLLLGVLGVLILRRLRWRGIADASTRR